MTSINNTIDYMVHKHAIISAGSSEYVDFAVLYPHDPVIYVRIKGIHGENGEFTGGEYLAEIILSRDYPSVPPHAKFLTPNGVAQPNTLISINRFGYHNEGYTQESGAYGVGMLLPAVLIQWRTLGPGMGLILAPTAENITIAARESAAYNKKNHSDILELFTRRLQ